MSTTIADYIKDSGIAVAIIGLMGVTIKNRSLIHSVILSQRIKESSEVRLMNKSMVEQSHLLMDTRIQLADKTIECMQLQHELSKMKEKYENPKLDI